MIKIILFLGLGAPLSGNHLPSMHETLGLIQGLQNKNRRNPNIILNISYKPFLSFSVFSGFCLTIGFVIIFLSRQLLS
jgi:hypothetical protein